MSFLSVFSLILFKLVAADEPICCVPAELEGHALVGQGSIFAMANGIDTYVNGSAHFAISMDLKKTYLRYKGVVLNSLFPKGKHIHMISLGDFSEVCIYHYYYYYYYYYYYLHIKTVNETILFFLVHVRHFDITD